MSTVHITNFRDGFPEGYSRIIGLDETVYNVGMELGILRLPAGGSCERFETPYGIETQLVLLEGEGMVTVGNRVFQHVCRKDVFNGNPWAFDIPPGVSYQIQSSRSKEIEFAVIRAENSHAFDPVALRPEEIPSEERGKELADGAMLRIVKAIFGDPNAPARPPGSNLVVGEVINLPGRWSSYPPHHHPHSEVYYYRFNKPEGYGFSHIDEPAPVVRTHDVVKILNRVPHDQVSAPGYTMWYLWCIRQIDGNRYEGNPPFTYFPEHEWVLDKTAKIWKSEET